jgi:hypothetical protein
MTPPADHPTPPHIELLDAPHLRPFDNAIAEARARWEEDLARYKGERVVFTDQRVSNASSE